MIIEEKISNNTQMYKEESKMHTNNYQNYFANIIS